MQKKHDMALINIIWGIFEGFTKEGIYADKRACKSHRMVGHPSEKDFKSIVSKTWSKTDLLLTLTSLILTTCFVQTSLVPEERWYNRIRIGWLWIILLYLSIFGIKQVCNSSGIFDVCERHTIIDYQVTQHQICHC